MGKRIQLTETQLRELVISMITEELGHSKSGMAYIGSFYVTNDLVSEDRKDGLKVGDFYENGAYDVYVYSHEGKLPHMHILNRELKKKKPTFDCCVQLKTNKYFPHSCHTSTMNTHQRLAFYNFISSQNQNPLFNGTYYEKAVTLWNDNNYTQVELCYRDEENKKDVIIPDYGNM